MISVPERAEDETTGPLADEGFEPEVLSSERVFAGHVWDVRTETFRYLDGVLTRHFVDHPGAVAVVAIDDEDRVLLIKQYRHPVRLREWELPAGLMDVDHEPPLETAKRELAEEVDLAAADWHLLADYAVSPGGSDEMIRIFLARGLTPTGDAFERSAEEQDMEQRWVPLDEAVEAIRDRRIQNSVITVGLLSAWLERSRGWTGLGDPETPWTRHRKH